VTLKKACHAISYIKYTIENPCGIWLLIHIHKRYYFAVHTRKSMSIHKVRDLPREFRFYIKQKPFGMVRYESLSSQHWMHT